MQQAMVPLLLVIVSGWPMVIVIIIFTEVTM